MRKNIVAAFIAGALVAGVAVVGGTALGQSSPSNEIVACKSGLGTLRVVSSVANCTSRETPLVWNKTGPAGPQGPAGEVTLESLEGLDGEACLTGTPDEGTLEVDYAESDGYRRELVVACANSLEQLSLHLDAEVIGYGTAYADGKVVAGENECGPSIGLGDGLDCFFDFSRGTEVTLVATPVDGQRCDESGCVPATSAVGEWTGCDSNPTPSTCVVTMSDARRVTHRFVLATP